MSTVEFKPTTFLEACIFAGVIPCGQMTINGISFFEDQVNASPGPKVNFSADPSRTEEVDVTAAATRFSRVVAITNRDQFLTAWRESAGGTDQGKFIGFMNDKLAEKTRNLRNGGKTVDSGTQEFSGYVPISMIREAFPSFKRAKLESQSGRRRIMLHRMPPSEDQKSNSDSILSRVHLYLGNQNRIDDDRWVKVVVWINPVRDSGLLQMNFVIETPQRKSFVPPTNEILKLKFIEVPVEFEDANGITKTTALTVVPDDYEPQY